MALKLKNDASLSMSSVAAQFLDGAPVALAEVSAVEDTQRARLLVDLAALAALVPQPDQEVLAVAVVALAVVALGAALVVVGVLAVIEAASEVDLAEVEAAEVTVEVEEASAISLMAMALPMVLLLGHVVHGVAASVVTEVEAVMMTGGAAAIMTEDRAAQTTSHLGVGTDIVTATANAIESETVTVGMAAMITHENADTKGVTATMIRDKEGGIRLFQWPRSSSVRVCQKVYPHFFA